MFIRKNLHRSRNNWE